MKFVRCLIVMPILSICVGCGQVYVGTYDAQLRLVEGKSETEKYPLAEAQAKFARYRESIELKSNGRYIQHVDGRVHEGDWWVENGNIGIRCDRQNGQALAKGLVRKGADFTLAIHENELVRGPYHQPDANVERFYVRR